MTDKSLISVADYKYDNPLSYESSRSSDICSDYSKDDQDSRSTQNLSNVKLNGMKNKDFDRYSSDSAASDDMFLECESDFAYSDHSEAPYLQHQNQLNLYKDSMVVEMKNGFSNGANELDRLSQQNANGSYKNSGFIRSDGRMKNMPSNNQNFNSDLVFRGREEFDDLLDLDSEPEMKENGHRHPNNGGQFIDPELVLDNRARDLSKFISNEKFNNHHGNVNEFNGIDKNGGFRGPIYDGVSDIGSDVNSEVESRMIDFHEAKKNAPNGGFGDQKLSSAQSGTQEPYLYEPEDEIDEIFDRVINCEYDPDFTFRPEALDPFVKISQELIARKNKAPSSAKTLRTGRKSSSRSSSSSSASSRSSTKDKDKRDKEKAKESSHTLDTDGTRSPDSKDGKSKSKSKDSQVSSDPSTTDSEKSKKTKEEDKKKTKEEEKLRKEKEKEDKNKNKSTKDKDKEDKKDKDKEKEREKEDEKKKINDEKEKMDRNDRGLVGNELERGRKMPEMYTQMRNMNGMGLRSNDMMRDQKIMGEMNDIDINKSESDVEKERERVRMLFEATKPDDGLSRRKSEEDELGKAVKGLKIKEDKKSKKSKHHRSDSEPDDDRIIKSDKKSEKKSSEKGSKTTKELLKSDKSEISEKMEKSEKSEKSSKDKKSDKMKKFPWKSTEYDQVFNTLGDCFSSGIIEHDSNPIILPRKGFYTMFFRNSRYPYDSNIDFYLFRIGFKYMLVNETRNQNFNIDDVVDYGNFRIKLSGSISLSPNVTKMALIYSNSDRQTLEFVLTPSAFDSKPKIVYKLFFSGPLLSLPLPLKFKRRLRVLSLDNSENLGTSVIGALYLLEKKLSELKKKKVNLADYFDYICGTGAGALIALCLLKGYSMKDLRAQWNLIVSGLFKWVYSLPSGIIFDYYYIEEFKKNFISILGTDFLCSKASPLCMVTCTNVRSNPYELFLFRNYGNSKFGSLDGTSYAPLWLVGWAACALPTYVRGPSNSHLSNIGYNMINKAHLVDGCLISSSPSLISLQELTNIYNVNLKSLVTDNMDLFLSIGTSKSETDTGSISTSTWQILLNCKNLMYNTQLQHLHVKSLFDEQDNKYHRIQLPIYPGCKHGKTSKEDVDAVLTSTIQYISRHDNQRIERIVNILNQ